MRPISSVLAMLSALVLVLTACGSSGESARTEDGKTVVRYQGWAGEVRFQELAEELGYYQKIKLDWVGNTTSGPQDIQSANQVPYDRIAEARISYGGRGDLSVVQRDRYGKLVYDQIAPF